VVRILAEVFPDVLILKPAAAGGQIDRWTHVEGNPSINATSAERAFGPANRRVLDDWIGAIEEDRQPICSGRAAMKAIEMVMAVYESALARGPVSLPLAKRAHPLDTLNR